VAPDLRCYNTSTNFGNYHDCNHENAVKDVIRLIKHYKREKAIIIGHDWGSAVAWFLASEYPQYVSKLGILCVPHPKVFASAYKIAPIQLAKSSYFFYFASPLGEWTFSIFDHYWLKKLLTAASPSYSVADLNHLNTAWSRKDNVKGMLNYYQFLLVNLLSKRNWTQIEPPTIVLMGENDDALDHRLGNPSVDMCKNGKFFLIQGSHFFHREKVEEVNNIIENFIKN